MLPPKETFETVAASLTPSERDQIEKRTWLLVVKAHGRADSSQLVARACFDVTAAAVSGDCGQGAAASSSDRRETLLIYRTATVSPDWLRAFPTCTITSRSPEVTLSGTFAFTWNRPATPCGAAPA